jgi:hypothetical protein
VIVWEVGRHFPSAFLKAACTIEHGKGGDVLRETREKGYAVWGYMIVEDN